MLDYPINPPIVIEGSKRRLESINDARAFVDDMLRERRFSKWREMLDRLDAVKNEEDAMEASGALRELLAMEHLLTG
jgi:hypothetical protein